MAELRKFSCVVLVLTNIATVNAASRKFRIVYGEDNRVETYQARGFQQQLAISTAGMIQTIKAIDLGANIMLPPGKLKDAYGLCDGQRFTDQPVSVTCSGFLVGPDLLVTAGHCITTQKDCELKSWVFDYKVNELTKRTSIIVPKENVYACERVIEARLEGSGDSMRDYSLIKLNRVVKGRSPLKYRVSGKINDGEDVTVIGHPTGLPQKVSEGGNVFKNTSKSFFSTNLDTFGGNSGSAVFNSNTNIVEGILVRGAKDYVKKSCGVMVNQVDDNIDGIDALGESVSRITDIPTLKFRTSFLRAASTGNIEKMKSLLKDIPTLLQIYDNQKNNALHLALASRQYQVVRLLLRTNMDFNQTNLNGETALHLAAFTNNKSAIYDLMSMGVNPLILDQFNVRPSGRSSYLSFRIRAILRSYERSFKL